jgi:hypothetical protein
VTSDVLLERGEFDVNEVDAAGRSLLMVAIQESPEDLEIDEVPQVGQILVDHGADVDYRRPETGKAALRIAIERSYSAVVALLIHRAGRVVNRLGQQAATESVDPEAPGTGSSKPGSPPDPKFLETDVRVREGEGEPVHLGAGEAVDLSVEEGKDESLLGDLLLDLAIQVPADRRIPFDLRLVDQRVELLGAAEVSERPLP